MTDSAFTGRSRKRTTRRGVIVAEHVAKLLITIGGIGTILSVSLIFFFLLWVVFPLFTGADLDGRVARAAPPGPDHFTHVGLDEYRTLLWLLGDDGVVRSVRLEDGERLGEDSLALDGTAPSVVDVSVGTADVALGYPDGRVALGSIGFGTTFLTDDGQPEELLALEPGETVAYDGGVVAMTPERQLRLQRLEVELGDPFDIAADGEGIAALDFADTHYGKAFVALTVAGGLSLTTIDERRDFMTGELRVVAETVDLPLELPAPGVLPSVVLLSDLADQVYAIWPDGRSVRFAIDAEGGATLAGSPDLLGEPDLRVTCAEFLLGGRTFVVGDSSGRIRAWFLSRPVVDGVEQSLELVAGHTLSGDGSPVTVLSSSPRSRLLAIGFADGTAQLRHLTSSKLVAETRVASGASVDALVLTPKEDGLVGLAGGEVVKWDADPGHPEASLASLFTPVWYEGYPGPEHVWQSTGGSDDFEPKLGLVPLVFGTIKATFYSMLFGAPLALLAAIFSSEFLSPRLRAPVKSLLELMASLPSVVLGFLAALVIAPFVQAVLPATMAVFLTVPLALLLGAYLWQLLPRATAIRWSGWQRLACIFFALPAGVAMATVVGPVIEAIFFAGDLEAWLSSERGDGTGGWLLLLLPLSGVAVALVQTRLVNPALRPREAGLDHAQVGRRELLKFLIGLAATVALAWVVSAVLASGVGLDPRGSFVGTYVQRNALIVGFVMGFAIIPIIYTLAEDALSSVPSHLRLASLGAGATPWQTAMRVIVPTAMSGLFSALMIGLGRAVGETMIVLMATGNTAIMDWNVFNGFRTLSANIAVELPEAVRDSTHYRVLFLAALTLFVMTFVLNTFAEVVRMRFRKRAYQL